MSLSAAQIARQIEMNENELDALAKYLAGGNGSATQRAAWQSRQKLISIAQTGWSEKYRQLTGGYYAMAGGKLVPFAEANARVDADEKRVSDEKAAKDAAAKAAQDAKDELNNLIGYLDTDHYRLMSTVGSKFENAFGQGIGVGLMGHLSRKLSGTNTAVLIGIGQRLKATGEKIVKARQAFNAKKYDRARDLAASAAKDLVAESANLQAWQDKVDDGGARAEVVIKVTAAVAAAAATGGTSLTLLQGAGVAAVGEGAQQGTTLLLKAASDGDTVSVQDATNALIETALAGAGSAVGGGALKGARMIASGLANRVVLRILSAGDVRTPLGKASERVLAVAGKKIEVNPRMVEYVTKLIEQYIEANFKTLVKKVSGMDASLDWDWWENAITPALAGVTAAKLSSL